MNYAHDTKQPNSEQESGVMSDSQSKTTLPACKPEFRNISTDQMIRERVRARLLKAMVEIAGETVNDE